MIYDLLWKTDKFESAMQELKLFLTGFLVTIFQKKCKKKNTLDKKMSFINDLKI